LIKSIALEVSLKAFGDKSEKKIKEVCETIYNQWRPLFKDMDEISVMFWVSDGSEILDYKGSLDDYFEWSKYIGVANPEIYGNIPDLPQKDLSMHHSPRLFCENPPDYTYRDLKHVVNAVREVFLRHGRVIRAGATFDPGPEFAISEFKYKNHNEICLANTMGDRIGSFVCCYARLNQDGNAYAGFPGGIEQDTSIGTFLGRQTKHFCTDLGFDYIWLSNGFGYGMETWGACGANFDGEEFTDTDYESTKKKIIGFWKDFADELPGFPIETRVPISLRGWTCQPIPFRFVISIVRKPNRCLLRILPGRRLTAISVWSWSDGCRTSPNSLQAEGIPSVFTLTIPGSSTAPG
jgi:hypothetical protein